MKQKRYDIKLINIIALIVGNISFKNEMNVG